jgi:hypothetical protein
MKTVVFLDMTPCSLVWSYQHISQEPDTAIFGVITLKMEAEGQLYTITSQTAVVVVDHDDDDDNALAAVYVSFLSGTVTSVYSQVLQK